MIVDDSLSILKRRRDPIAADRAIRLLHSEDSTWINAADYLGVCGRQEAVPYLIKALRSSAPRSDIEHVKCLRSLTGQDFGSDFGRWQSWWIGQHPGYQFNWTSQLGPASPSIQK
jgi:HEAT repeat protein